MKAKSNIRILLIMALSLLLTACATPNVSLPSNFWQNHNGKVAVALGKIPPAGFYQEGETGLLEIAINDMATSNFRKYLKRTNWLPVLDMRSKFVKNLKTRQFNAIIYDPFINVKKLPSVQGDKKIYAEKDFTFLRKQIKTDKLLVILVNQIGAVREYYSVIPLGSPKAVCNLEGMLIDLHNDQVLWRFTSNVQIPIRGKWSQPPTYPNFNDALNKAVTTATQEILDNFFSS